MDLQGPSARSAARLFVVYAVASLVPVVLLGLVLAATYRGGAAKRGLAEGRTEAGLLARTAVDPLLRDLHNGLTADERGDLQRMSSSAVATDEITRLRVRDLRGTVLFSSDGYGVGEPADPESREAAGGRVIAKVTHLEADQPGDGPVGPRVVEVYWPLTAGKPAHRVGILEVYLPYSRIAADVSVGIGALYRDLIVGLAVLYLLLALISVSVTRRLRAQLARNAFLAEHDLLTGLPARLLFRRRVTEALAAAASGGPPVTVAVVDVDRFKQVNDALGHTNGDELLRQLSARLTATLSGRNLVARLGGDEFGLLLTGPGTAADAARRLTALRSALEQEAELAGVPLSTESSFGFAMAPDDGVDADALLQRAEVAMYVAKSGPAEVVRYDPRQERFDPAGLGLLAELRRAIGAGDLRLHYQPKASLVTGEVVAVEALIRWWHPERGLLYPGAFVPYAEQTGLIEPLTAWVVREALRQLVAWDGHPAVGPELAVCINVSARNLAQADFAESVEGPLRESGIAAERLILEITETAFVAEQERAGRSLRRLGSLGVRFSLDDFGQGQTSLALLASLPLHEVKIDRAFVTDMLTSPSHAAIVRSVIELAHNLGFVVVAEGVETADIMAELGGLGCDIAQGYHLARPMPAAEVPGWLAARSRAVS